MKKFLTILSTVFCMGALAPTAAEAGDGFYAGAIGGANWLQANKHRGFQLEFDTGYNVGGFVGYEFCWGLAVEAEFTYRHNTLRKVKFESTSFKPHGHLNSMSYMANFIYEFNLSHCWCVPLFPYLGAGLGYEHQQLKLGHCSSSSSSNSGNSKNGFGWQILAGIGYVVNCHFDVALDYHFNKGRANRLYNHSLSLAAAYHF